MSSAAADDTIDISSGPALGASIVAAGDVKPNADPANLAEIKAVRQALKAEMRNSFGGIWIDEDETTTVVATTAPGLGQAIEVSGKGLSRAPFVVVTVDYPLAILEEVYERLVDEAGDEFALGGVPIAAIGIDVRKNRVEVSAITDDAGVLADLRQALPMSVDVGAVNERAQGLCSGNSNCADPLKAGLKGYRNGSFACMTGFIFEKSGNYYWATAGHCASGTEGWRTPSEAWQHPSTTIRGSVAYQGWYDQSYGDIALIKIASSQRSNKMCLGQGTCNIRSITSRQESTANEEIGQQVCVQRAAGNYCGTLYNYPYTVGVCKPNSTDCRVIRGLRRATFSTVPGDSGGPVYVSSQAIGIVSAGYPGSTHTLYSHVWLMEGQSGAAVKTNSN